MAYILVEKIPVLTFEYELYIEKHWNQGLSKFLINQYDYPQSVLL